VAFCRPLKGYWRKVLDEWKYGRKKAAQTLSKDIFPLPLTKPYTLLYPNDEQKSDNMKAGGNHFCSRQIGANFYVCVPDSVSNQKNHNMLCYEFCTGSANTMEHADEVLERKKRNVREVTRLMAISCRNKSKCCTENSRHEKIHDCKSGVFA